MPHFFYSKCGKQSNSSTALSLLVVCCPYNDADAVSRHLQSSPAALGTYSYLQYHAKHFSSTQITSRVCESGPSNWAMPASPLQHTAPQVLAASVVCVHPFPEKAKLGKQRLRSLASPFPWRIRPCSQNNPRQQHIHSCRIMCSVIMLYTGRHVAL